MTTALAPRPVAVAVVSASTTSESTTAESTTTEGAAPEATGTQDAAAEGTAPGPMLDTARSGRGVDRRRRTRLVAVPDAEPPFDDELTPTDRVRRLRPTTPQLRGRASFPSARARSAGLASGAATAAGGAGLTAPGRPAIPTAGPTTGPAAGRSVGQQPPLRQVSTVLARALVEVITGVRGVTQLRDHCSPTVFAALLDRKAQHGNELAKLQSTHVHQGQPEVAEVAAVFRRGQRVRALAFQLTAKDDGRWQITALQIG